MHGIDVRDVEAFLGVVDNGGFRAAAAALYTSQPSLSRRIRNLEAALGVPLFERGAWGARLTGQGRAFLEASRHIDRSILDAVTSVSKEATERIRFGATAGATGYSAPFLVRWRRDHPAVRVEVVADGIISLRQRLRDGSCDVAIIAGTVGSSLAALPFGTVRIIALLPADHPLGLESDPLPVARLHGEQVMMNGPLYLSSLLFRTTCTVEGIACDVVHESGAGQDLAAHVEAGLGIAIFGDRTDLRFVPHLPRRVLVDGEGRELTFPLNVCWYPTRAPSARALRFAEELSRFGEGISPRGGGMAGG